MGILPKQRVSRKRTHFLLREDLRHMEELTAQTRLLCGNHIESKEQLLDFQNGLNQEISTLLDSRKSLYHRLRRCKNDRRKQSTKNRLQSFQRSCHCFEGR